MQSTEETHASAPPEKKKERGGIKIKIGMSSASNTAHQQADHSQAPPQSIAELPSSNSTIFELCADIDRRRGKRKRSTADQTKATAAKEKARQAALSKSRAREASSKGSSENISGPQVEIVNGQIVIRESSLTVPALGTASHEEFEEVEEGIHPTATYSSFAPSTYSHTWGIEETERFYEALRQCGTDFSLMQAFFPRRARKQLKNKFYREEKQHPELIKAALNVQLPLNLAPFEVHLGSMDDAIGSSSSVPGGGGGAGDTTAGTTDGASESVEGSGEEIIARIAAAAAQKHQQELFVAGLDEENIVDV